jgi:hypothetical protein
MTEVQIFLDAINKALESLKGVSYNDNNFHKIISAKVKSLLPKFLTFPITTAYIVPQKTTTLDAFKYHLFILKKDIIITKKGKISDLEYGVINSLTYLINERFAAPTFEEMIVLQEKGQKMDRIKYIETEINEQVIEITRMKAELNALRKEKKELEKENP